MKHFERVSHWVIGLSTMASIVSAVAQAVR